MKVWIGKTAFLVLGLASMISVPQAVGQVTIGSGSASGWVIGEFGDAFGDIGPSQSVTNIMAGAGSLTTNNISDSPNLDVQTQFDFPNVRVRADSQNLDPNEVAYGAAYFADELTVTGGTGSFSMLIRWDFQGTISGEGGEHILGPGPTYGPREGQAAVNFRAFLEGFGQPRLDLGDNDLMKNLALEPTGSLEVPNFDPTDPFGGSNFPDGVGGFVYEELDPDTGLPNGQLYEAWYTDQTANDVAFFVGGAQFTWEYDVPVEFGILLEGWAAAGGVVDFYNQGMLTEIVLPAGAIVTSAGGGTYNVSNVPEPGSAAVLIVGIIGMALRRRRCLG